MGKEWEEKKKTITSMETYLKKQNKNQANKKVSGTVGTVKRTVKIMRSQDSENVQAGN